MSIVIVDSGGANLTSIKNAFEKISSQAVVSIDENIIYKKINKTNISFFCENETLKVIELKCAENFDENKLIKNFPFDRKRFSKYCNGIEKIYKLN